MSREALSLDISRVVSRVVRGEPVDAAEKGAALAAKYPELGMSAELIGSAITRAADMVDRMRETAVDPVWPSEKPSRAPLAPKNGANPGHTPKGANGASAPISNSIDEALASAIDTEIGALVSGQAASSAAPVNGAGAQGRFAGGAVARLRRALFRH